VYYRNTVPDANQNITITVIFNYCVGSTGVGCSTPITQVQNNQNISVGITPSYFNYTTPSSNNPLTNLTINLSPSTFNTAYNISAKYNGVPDGSNDFSVINSNTLTIPQPPQGTYYITITANQTANTNFSSTSGSCQNKTGPNCDIPLTNASAAYLELWKSDTVAGNTFKYFFLSGFNTNNLLAVVKPSIQSKVQQLKLYAAFNHIPTISGTVAGNYDLSGCTGTTNQCANLIILSTSGGQSPVSGTWYLLLVNTGGDNVDYQIWFNATCPNACSGQGNCNVDTGSCSCNTNFQGLACSEDNMFIEYVILIIIAALVLISALLGLIAWAYMRKRHSQYEVIKN